MTEIQRDVMLRVRSASAREAMHFAMVKYPEYRIAVIRHGAPEHVYGIFKSTDYDAAKAEAAEYKEDFVEVLL